MMADFKLSRIRFTWKGDWSSATSYVKDDIVRYGGKSYVCLQGHTSSANIYDDINYIDTTTDPDTAAPKWVLWFDGYEWKDVWTASTFYSLGDIVKYNSVVYVCNESHTSALNITLGLEADQSKWTPYAKTDYWTNEWNNFTRYRLNDLVKYQGIIYRCIAPHTSTITGTLDVDAGNWEIVVPAERWTDDWTINRIYAINDIVRYGGIVYRCIEEHASASTIDDGLEEDSDKWEIVLSGIQLRGDYDYPVRYRLNDLVKFGSGQWICTIPHVSSLFFSTVNWALYVPGLEFETQWETTVIYQPGDIVRYGGYAYSALEVSSGVIPSTNPLFWRLLTLGFNVLGEWTDTVSYRVGDLIRRNGNLYVAIKDNLDTETDDEEFWNLVVHGNQFRNRWVIGTTYVLGDIVTYAATAYRCFDKHVASFSNVPAGDSGPWELYLEGDLGNKMLTQGDLLTHDDAETARLAIGLPGQVLVTDNGLDPTWRYFGFVDKVYYVAPNGTDALGFGTTLTTPWKTVRYACENVEGPATIFIKTGIYQEVLPIIVPADVALCGDELRSTEIQPAGSLISSTDIPYSLAALEHLKEIIADVIENQLIDKSVGNQENQFTSSAPGTTSSSLAAEGLLENAIDYINFRLNNIGSNISVSGSNDATAASGFQQAADVLENNKNFLKEEVVAFINFTYPGYANTYDETACKRDVGRYIDALKYDLVYTGNYKTLLAARYYVNAVTGSLTENMFFVRNGTGIRNMTLKGLTGTLGPQNAYLTRRPTAGAYVSLDPGWGPDDERVWITTRSCYVQNVTTLGTGCVGLKVDGSLHDGGNRSIVANDFTQVLSDGIGAWITNNGLSELVSVFSYYGHIGYLAENGGKIRATNGNSSYGTYGCVSEGVDVTEEALVGTVNNRNQEAQVSAAFAGQANDQVLILEYANCGQDYTSATFNVSGAGVGLELTATDFRNNAVYEVRIRQLTRTSSIGGGGYVNARNNAQAGDAVEITIAGNDENLEEVYIGMRLIITSGTGVGQYGFILDYDFLTKVAIIAKESFEPLTVTATTAATNTLVTTDTSTLETNQPIIFSFPSDGSTTETLGGLPRNTVYYVSGIVDETRFSISENIGGPIVSLTDDVGEMFVYSAGWEQVASGVSIEPILDTTTVYSIEPRVTFSVPDSPTGIRAKGRVRIASGRIDQVVIWDPGSGYTGEIPTVTLTDPNNNTDAVLLCRVGNGVLAQPTFVNRGTGYQTSTTVITVAGDGFADIFQVGKFLTVSGLSRVPGPGANLTLFGFEDEFLYKIVAIQDLGGGTARFQISPVIGVWNAYNHGLAVNIREKYSQCRLTGHDFLDIGTGNFIDTNYPNVNEFLKAPENEVSEKGGGRVFYTSTDQDGNFRVGELFKVEQSTGIVTISADIFSLSGLEELSIGGVSIGGSAVVIREFSTDVTFTADSNNIIPTQRAIKEFLSRRISGGGSDAQTGQLVAGTVKIGPQEISSTTTAQVIVDKTVKITGGIDGSMLAMTLFMDSFYSTGSTDDDVQ
jgi:hypothetical protein